MDTRVRKWLFDILFAIERIETLIERTQDDYEVFAADFALCWGVERGFEVIGEAMNRIERHHPGIGITDLKGYIDMRNIISHGYDIVSYKILWKTATEELPILKKELQALLQL